MRLRNDFFDIKIDLGADSLALKYEPSLSESYRIEFLARLLKFICSLSERGATLAIGNDEPKFRVEIQEPLLEKERYASLAGFAELISRELFSCFPESEVKSSLESVAKHYFSQEGLYSLISSRGKGRFFKITGAELPEFSAKHLAIYIPVTLLFLEYRYCAIMLIQSDMQRPARDEIILPRADVQQLHETIVLDRADTLIFLEEKAREIAKAEARTNETTLAAIAIRDEDGTYHFELVS